MFDSRDLRAAALCFGIPGLIGALPIADGTIAIEDAAHVLACYRYDLPALLLIRRIDVTDEASVGPTLAGEASVGPSVRGELTIGPTISSEATV